jgi:hypothetical protein
MYFLRILSVMLLSTIAFISNAQITGKVFDSVTHEPLIGANIEANGVGAVTNQQGLFSLKNTPTSITISFVGYKNNDSHG